MTINTNYNLDPTCFLPPNHEAVYPLDCESRRTDDKTRQMQLTVLMAHLKNGTLAGFLERQIGIVKSRRYRVAAKREVVS